MKAKKTSKQATFSPSKRLLHSLYEGNLWLSILSLSSKSPVYAYSLPDQIEAKFMFKPSRLMIYLVLYKLEAEGLLSSSEEGQRRYYSISAKGRKCLNEGAQLLISRGKEL